MEAFAKALTRIKHQENLHGGKHSNQYSKGNLHHWQEQYFGKRTHNVYPHTSWGYNISRIIKNSLGTFLHVFGSRLLWYAKPF